MMFMIPIGISAAAPRPYAPTLSAAPTPPTQAWPRRLAAAAVQPPMPRRRQAAGPRRRRQGLARQSTRPGGGLSGSEARAAHVFMRSAARIGVATPGVAHLHARATRCARNAAAAWHIFVCNLSSNAGRCTSLYAHATPLSAQIAECADSGAACA